MRMSDWSSDVCSSDLRGIDPGSLAVLRFRVVPAGRRYRPAVLDHAVERLARLDHAQLAARALLDRGAAVFTLEFGHLGGECVIALLQAAVVAPLLFDLLRQCAHVAGAAVRSEEHTSELQSLMRISYAVFCLK